MNALPPQASPQPPGDDEWRPPTGEHPVTKDELRRTLNVNDVKTTVAMVVVAIGTVFAAYRVVLSEARAQSDAGVSVIERRVTNVEQKQAQQSADLHEVQVDIRELYRSMQTGRPSPRLEAPLPPAKDGGQ